jgi:hypothetical protein
MRNIYTPYGPEPEFYVVGLEDLEPSFGEYFDAAAGNVIRENPVSSIYRIGELPRAGHWLDGLVRYYGESAP